MLAKAIRFFLALVPLWLISPAQAAEPWDVPFSSDTKAILESARAVSASDDGVILLEEHRFKIDSTGRTSSVTRMVMRITQEDALEDWSSVAQQYQPWNEGRPEIRARVIAGDGTVHWLDTKTVADAPAGDDDPAIYSDRRVLRAPLPAMAVGAVVEYEISTRETALLLDAGMTRRISIAHGLEVRNFRLTIDTAKNVAVRTASQLIPESAIRRSSVGGATRIECEFGPIVPDNSTEWQLPPELSPFPYFSFSTGTSWQAVAERYESIVDQQIRSADLKAPLEGVELKGSPLAVATRLAGRLHKEVRYTGVEFGEAEIVPRTPAEILQRKYGDCKDQAAMLVAMLRSAGQKAYVALLDAGTGTDIDTDLPGLGVFNHAIVYLPGDTPLWIDATAAQTRIGDLPEADQGRWALIAAQGITSLVRTPESSAADNTSTHQVEIRLSEFGLGEIRETVTATGALESRARAAYGGSDTKKVKESLERYAKNTFLAKGVGEYSATRQDDFAGTFRLSLQALSCKRALTQVDEAMAVALPQLLFAELPYALTRGLSGNTSGVKIERRKHDFVFSLPHQMEYHYRIVPPALFRPKELPPAIDEQLGPAHFERTSHAEPDGTVDLVYRLNTGKRRQTADEFEAFREGLRKYYAQPNEVIGYVSQASEYVALGQTSKALQLAQEAAAKGGPAAKVRLAYMLVAAGAGNSAITLADELTREEQVAGPAWQALAWAYEHDSFGRPFRGNWNRELTEKALREALKLDADDLIAQFNLASLLEHNAEGQLYGEGARLDEAIATYRSALKAGPNPGIEQRLAVALLFAGRYTEVKEAAAKSQASNLEAILPAVITATSQGPARAIIAIQAEEPDNRTRMEILVAASQFLVELRRYDSALELSKAAARLADTPELKVRVSGLEKMKRYQDALYPATDPRSPVQQLLLAMSSAQPDYAQIGKLLSPAVNWTPQSPVFAKLRQDVLATRLQLEANGFGTENIRDFVASMTDLQSEGEDDRGYIVSGSLRSSGQWVNFFVTREDGEYRIIGSSDRPEQVGALVLRYLAQNNLKAAQWWLDKMVSVAVVAVTQEGGSIPAVRLLWSGVTAETRGPEAVRLAAAALLGSYGGDAGAIRILREARTRISDTYLRTQLDLAFCESLYAARGWSDLLVAARRLAADPGEADSALRFVLSAEAGAEQWKELQGEAARKLRTAPEYGPALRSMALALIHLGDRPGAAKCLKKLTASNAGDSSDWMLEAWNSLLSGRASTELLKAFTEKDPVVRSDPDYWYTAGLLQATLDQPDEALQSLTHALDRDDSSRLDSRPWVLAGKIYERFGLKEAAASAYQNARSAPGNGDVAAWAISLLPESARQAGK